MRTFVIFPAHAGKEIEASSPEVAIKKYRKVNPSEAGNLIYAVNKANVYSELERIGQGVVITETPKAEIRFGTANEILGDAACDPEDSKPEHKDGN